MRYVILLELSAHTLKLHSVNQHCQLEQNDVLIVRQVWCAGLDDIIAAGVEGDGILRRLHDRTHSLRHRFHMSTWQPLLASSNDREGDAQQLLVTCEVRSESRVVDRFPHY